MKRSIVQLFLFFCVSISMYAQQSLNEMPWFHRYEQANKELPAPAPGEKRVVFIGNSITDAWPNVHPEFFVDNNYIGRGIGGQTSPQLLMRFQQDVIALKPVAVVINIGTNDIALNTGPYNEDLTFDSIRSMAEIAKANGVKVILTSVLPVAFYPWRKEVTDVPAKIDSLNARIQAYAISNNITYVDYHPQMRDEKGGMIASYADDGVHPTDQGYRVMESIIKPVVEQVVK